MKKYLLFCSLIFISGCVGNPYAKFYNDYLNGEDIHTLSSFIINEQEPKIFPSTNFDADSKKLLENNYALIGMSGFNARAVDNSKLEQQAKNVGAEIVLFNVHYTNTVSGSVPIETPDVQTQTTYGHVYGSSGYAYGTAHTTTYGSKTTYMPYSVDRYDYVALFWAKRKPPILGVIVNELTPEQRIRIESNKGVSVSVVIRNTIAYESDILEGDIIKTIGGKEIADLNSFSQTVSLFEGQTVKIKLIRKNKNIIKTITMNRKS